MYAWVSGFLTGRECIYIDTDLLFYFYPDRNLGETVILIIRKKYGVGNRHHAALNFK